MRKLYAYNLDCDRMGYIRGLFIEDEDVVQDALDKFVYFGEVLGKYSDISTYLGPEQLAVKSEDQEFLDQLENVLGTTNISGYNPLDYISDDEEDE